MAEGFIFDKQAAQQIMRAAKIVLNAGDYGSSNLSIPGNGVIAWPLEIASNLPGGGCYLAKRARLKTPPVPINTAATLTFSTAFDFPDDADVVLLNQAEAGKATHNASGIVIAFRIPVANDQGKPTFATNYNRAIREIRIKPDGSCIEVSYADKETYEDDDFLCKIDLTDCPSGVSASEFTSF